MQDLTNRLEELYVERFAENGIDVSVLRYFDWRGP
jgi:hypothetical protein